MHMFKLIINNNQYVSNLIDLNNRSHNYDTRNRNQLSAPFPRVDAIKFNFHYQFIHVWNNIPDVLKNAPTVKAFKRSLIAYFLDLYES